MVPVFYKVLDRMPLTPNGKINRKALPEISDADIIRGEYVQPQNEMERSIVGILKKELGNNISKIGVTDNFFDIGMDSPSAIKVLNQINKELDLSLKPLDLFQYPNVQSLINNLLKIETEEELIPQNIAEDIDSMVDLF